MYTWCMFIYIGLNGNMHLLLGFMYGVTCDFVIYNLNPQSHRYMYILVFRHICKSIKKTHKYNKMHWFCTIYTHIKSYDELIYRIRGLYRVQMVIHISRIMQTVLCYSVLWHRSIYPHLSMLLIWHLDNHMIPLCQLSNLEGHEQMHHMASREQVCAYISMA